MANQDETGLNRYVLTHKPTYPVVHPNPSYGTAISHFELKDWGAVGALGVGGYIFGFFGGL